MLRPDKLYGILLCLHIFKGLGVNKSEIILAYGIPIP